MSWSTGVLEQPVSNVRDFLSTTPYKWLDRGACVYLMMKTQDLLSLAEKHFPHETMFISSLRFLVRRLNQNPPHRRLTLELKTWPREGACAGVWWKVT
jgi:hypothetical protein